VRERLTWLVLFLIGVIIVAVSNASHIASLS
jgi:hypothetical protein